VRTKQNLWVLGTFSLGAVLWTGANHLAFADDTVAPPLPVARKSGPQAVQNEGAPHQNDTIPLPVLFVLSPDPPAASGLLGGQRSHLSKDAAGRPISSSKLPGDRVANAGKSTTVDVAMAGMGEPTRPSSLFPGPSLRETGRVGTAIVYDPGFWIQLTPDSAMPTEEAVQPAEIDVNRPLIGPRAGLLSRSVLAQQLGKQVPTLRDCRLEVARQQQLPWNEVAAGQVTLQWNILSTGAVADATVVAVDPIDLHVLDCVHSKMRRWTFTRPSSGSIVHVVQPFAFR